MMNQPAPGRGSVLSALMQVLEDRRAASPDVSYVARLYRQGPARIAEKIAEETRELIDAAAETGPGRSLHIVHEAANLLFHALVLLSWTGVSLADVEGELAKRFGTSGLDEAAGRVSDQK